ncbi:Type II site-specific deoxyribonuclease [Desulfofundulus kuznetsovii DSM 6115]|uniref:Type II site-specific deoxyribonuclease n=1 Tax=Desulfofundulus kuznetsovii (strain DSM 6115 / VKM B-1805 / 17) TaxID=760568 RepID=A0AAU8PFE1_DESK7|nr:Type II site-specific deoxyribonuclease [Desulfofundulus kuznetsovii DSM 6115]
MKPELTRSELIIKAKEFCESESLRPIPELFGVTDGKAVGTFIEHRFKSLLEVSYLVEIGNSAQGIDLPSVNTDIKTTSIKQPQSSCPFKSARQKIYGLGYNLLLFVYDKQDDTISQTAKLNFVSCVFIDKSRTGDYQTTRGINEILQRNGNRDDIIAFLEDRRLPVDEIGMLQLADEIIQNPPLQGYLTISNALQWRLQYGRIVELDEAIDGIIKIV